MVRIKISPEQVRQVGNQFKTESQNSQAMVQRLNSTIEGMMPEWEGLTQQRFYQDFQQWKTSMTQFVELLSSIGQQLDAIAVRFEQADQV